MKECELCEMPARMYCESDQASLCWRCDSKVHSANFLVARHSRSLLCQVCQSPTPWKASGGKLGSTVSFCERCVDDCDGVVHKDDEGSEDGNEDELEILDDDDEEEIEEEEEEEENQVVPLASSTPPPLSSSSCSTSEESSLSGGSDEDDDDEIDRALSLKRLRSGNVDQVDIGSSSSQKMVETAREASSSGRPSKQQKRQVQITRSESESAAIIASLNELQKRLIGKNR